MPDPSLTEPMQRRVRQFCEEIAGHNGLPDEVREELETYFQDRMLGYLTREDVPTEEEAFILAREHFGDEQLVKDLLLNVHEDRPLPAMNKWFFAGAALAFGGYVYTMIPGLLWVCHLDVFEQVIVRLPLHLFLLFFALSAAFLLVALAFNWRRNRDSLDRLFGWYFLVLVVGGLLHAPPWFWIPNNPVFYAVWFLLPESVAVVVVIGFFRREPWTKWAVLGLVALSMAFYWRLGISHMVPQVAGAVSAGQTAATYAMPASAYVEVPPNWYLQSLHLLALIHCFSPRPRCANNAVSRAPVAE